MGWLSFGFLSNQKGVATPMASHHVQRHVRGMPGYHPNSCSSWGRRLRLSGYGAYGACQDPGHNDSGEDWLRGLHEVFFGACVCF